MEDAEQVLTVKEVAAILKIHIKTVYALVYNGSLQGFKIGPRSWRFKKAEVDKLMTNRPSSAR